MLRRRSHAPRKRFAPRTVFLCFWISLFFSMFLSHLALAQQVEFETDDGSYKVYGVPHAFYFQDQLVPSPGSIDEIDSLVIKKPDGSFTKAVPLSRLKKATKESIELWIADRKRGRAASGGKSIGKKEVAIRFRRVDLKDPVFVKNFPVIYQFFRDYQKEVQGKQLTKEKFQSLEKKMRQSLGKEATEDPMVQFLIALIESDANIDRSGKFLALTEKYTAFWEAWKSYVVAQLVYRGGSKACVALEKFKKALIEESRQRLEIPYNTATSAELQESAYAIAWVQDTAKQLQTLEDVEVRWSRKILEDPELKEVIARIQKYEPVQADVEANRKAIDQADAAKKAEILKMLVDKGRQQLRNWRSTIAREWADGLNAYNMQVDRCQQTYQFYQVTSRVLSQVRSQLSAAESELSSAEARSEDDTGKAAAIARAEGKVGALEAEVDAAESENSAAWSMHRRNMNELQLRYNVLTVYINNVKQGILQFEVDYRPAIQSDPDFAAEYSSFKGAIAAILAEFPALLTFVYEKSEKQKKKDAELDLVKRLQLSLDELFEKLNQQIQNP